MDMGQEKRKPKGRFRWGDTPAWGEADGVTHDQRASTFHHSGVAHRVNPPASHCLGQEASGSPGPIPGLQSELPP